MLSRAEEVLNYICMTIELSRDSLIAALLFTDVCDLTGPTKRRGKPDTKIYESTLSKQVSFTIIGNTGRAGCLFLPSVVTIDEEQCQMPCYSQKTQCRYPDLNPVACAIGQLQLGELQ